MRRLLVKFFTAATLFFCINLNATTLEQLSFENMVEKANACVMTKVINSTYQVRDGQSVTVTTLKVLKTAFGSTEQTISLVTPGGEKPMGRLKTSEVIAGAPRFFSQQENLMLVSLNSQTNEYQIIGFNQGLFPIQSGNVVLPQSAGGNMSITDAIETISEERSKSDSVDSSE